MKASIVIIQVAEEKGGVFTVKAISTLCNINNTSFYCEAEWSLVNTIFMYL